MLKNYWVSCPKFTVGVEIDFVNKHETKHGVIVQCPPMVQKFHHQYFVDLIMWILKTQGQVEVKPYGS